MLGYCEWLLEDLPEMVREIDDDDECVRKVLIILAAVEGEIPETFYRLYTAGLEVDHEKLQNALAYFAGIGEIKVYCDCSPEDKNLCDIHTLERTNFFKFGKNSVGTTPEWYATRNDVRSMYTDLWS